MQRTTIMLPEKLKKAAERQARKDGVSLGELIRRGLHSVVKENRAAYSRVNDPAFQPTWFFPPGPSDLSKNHDKYLYGPKPKAGKTRGKNIR